MVSDRYKWCDEPETTASKTAMDPGFSQRGERTMRWVAIVIEFGVLPHILTLDRPCKAKNDTNKHYNFPKVHWSVGEIM